MLMDLFAAWRMLSRLPSDTCIPDFSWMGTVQHRRTTSPTPRAVWDSRRTLVCLCCWFSLLSHTILGNRNIGFLNFNLCVYYIKISL